MSLRTVEGQSIGVTLQDGIIEDPRGSKLTEFIEMSAKADTEYVGTAPAPFSCEVEESTFGMPTWLFWTLVAIVIVAIIAIVVVNVVDNRRTRRERRN